MAENIREWGRKNGGNSTAKLLKRLLSPSSILVTAFSQLRKKEKGKRENEWDKNESLRCWKDRCTFSVFLYMCVPLLPRVKRRWCTTPPNADQFGGKQSGRQAHFFTFGRPSFSSLFFASLYFYSLSVQSIARQSAAVFFFFFSSSLSETQQQLTSSSHWVWCFLRKTFSLLLNIFGNWKMIFQSVLVVVH